MSTPSQKPKPRGLIIDKIDDKYIASFIIGREIVFICVRSLEELKEILKREFEIEIGTTTFQPPPS
jgi:histidinol phosphatase-like PHP family hydrolase